MRARTPFYGFNSRYAIGCLDAGIFRGILLVFAENLFYRGQCLTRTRASADSEQDVLVLVGFGR